MNDFLSATRIPATLLPTEKTLEELRVTDFKTRWRGQDESISNFSGFIALKKLWISANCFFRTGITRAEVYKLLPPVLEEIYVYLSLCLSLICRFLIHAAIQIYFDHRCNIPSSAISKQPAQDKWKYDWLLDIAIKKSSNFPYLWLICLKERV